MPKLPSARHGRVPARLNMLLIVAGCGLAVAFMTSFASANDSADEQSPPRLEPADTVAGYVARLLINETPFPGERGWVSEEDTRAAMLSILWVLHSRLHCVPPGYRQEQIAAVRADDIIDVITAGGEKGQCDGFYRDRSGRFVAVPRVHARIDNLLKLASKGSPGRFARLINYAQGLASAYVQSGINGADRFADLRCVGKVEVTGRAYAWMADRDLYNPGGNFVKIPDDQNGALGANRFFTLRSVTP
jgi:hypothetical protein